MATGKIVINEGTGLNTATNTISEDAVTKHLGRVVVNTSAGVEVVPLSESDFDTKVGSLTEAAPVTDTASSGLNGRLQRLAQRITSLIALLPASLGQKTMANGLAVSIASDQSAIPVTATNATAANLKAQVVSGDATGAAVPANAYYGALNAQTALPAAATAGNLTGLTGDKFGRQVVLPGIIRDLVGTQTTTISASTSETTIVTAAASTFKDLTLLVISNTSATAVRIDFRDTTGGSVLFSAYIPASDVRGFSVSRPIPQTTVNTNWTAQSSASVTDLRIYAVFDNNK